MSTMTEYQLVEVEECNLCGKPSSEAQLLGYKDRYGFDTMPLQCSCGLAYLGRRLSASDYALFYADDYRPLVSAFHQRAINAETIQAEQHEYARSVGDWLDPCLHFGSFLLDVGGSTGVIAEHLADRFGMGAIVIDPSVDEVHEAGQRGVIALCHSIEDISFAGEVGLVVMCRTIDHLLDIKTTLCKIRALLGQGGSFFVDALDWLSTQEFKLDHPYNLCDYTMREYLSLCGFEIVKSERAGKHIRYLCR